MKYTDCTIDNLEDAKFYNGCGHPLELTRPSCNKLNPPDSIFCNGYGQQIVLVSKTNSKDLSFVEILDKIQIYLPKGLAGKILYLAKAWGELELSGPFLEVICHIRDNLEEKVKEQTRNFKCNKG